MRFHSFLYILLFLPLAVMVYWGLMRKINARAAKVWMIIASMIFYAYGDLRYIPLLLGSSVFNYSVSRGIVSFLDQNQKRAKGLLIAGVSVHLALLAYFKYTHFFLDTFNNLAESKFPSHPLRCRWP
jgi:alginate O-acetyltransferase complex protein AlgI